MPVGVGATVKRRLNWTTSDRRSLLNLTEVGVLEIRVTPIEKLLRPVLKLLTSLDIIDIRSLCRIVVGTKGGEIFDHFST